MPQSYNPWPHAIMGFFGLLIAALVSVVWFTLRQPNELVDVNYYDQEIRFQSRIDSLRRTAALGATVQLEQQAGRLILLLPLDQVHGGIIGTIHLFRPSNGALDRTQPLQVDPTGRQEIDVRSLAAGHWKLRIEWQVGEVLYYREDSLVL